MILKTAANYNDEGGYIEAWKNSDGTTEVKLIPKSGGGDEGKNGLLALTISPAITTTPALDSLVPIYYEDLTEEQKEDGVTYKVTTSEAISQGDVYTVTVTPTSDFYAFDENLVTSGKGEPSSFTFTADPDNLGIGFTLANEIPDQSNPEKFFSVNIGIKTEQSPA